jgi:plasmid maintenance system antidote protein VapI
MTAEIWPPAQFILDECDERGWTVRDLSTRAGIPFTDVLDILAGAEITPDRATSLARAFGTSPTLWLRLQIAWDTSLAAEIDRLATPLDTLR